MTITENTVVQLHYRLSEENAGGELIENTYDSESLIFLVGTGEMMDAFENQLIGLEDKALFSFTIPFADAYGELNEEAVGEVPKSLFDIDGVDQEDLLVVGRILPLHDDNGESFYGTVLEVGDENVTIDFNHPLAGINLYFSGEILNVREATALEIENGYAEGQIKPD